MCIRDSLFKMLLQPPESHMRQVLSPFKIGNGHATGVQEDIGNDHDTALVQREFGTRRCRTIGALSENFRSNAVTVVQRDLILERRRNQNVAFCIPDSVRGKRLAAWEVSNGPCG